MGIFPNFGQTQPNLDDMRRQIGAIDPADAKSRVEGMLRSGQMTLQRLEELKAQAKDIARELGL